MDLEEYRKRNTFEVEAPSGLVFKMRKPRLQAYDKFLQFADEKGVELGNPDKKILRRFPAEISNILLPSCSIEPKIVAMEDEVENPSSELNVDEIDPRDLAELLSEVTKHLGSIGKKAKERTNFRGEQQAGSGNLQSGDAVQEAAE